jgi:vacuolar-type H+-ATPase subunit I/STV1
MFKISITILIGIILLIINLVISLINKELRQTDLIQNFV